MLEKATVNKEIRGDPSEKNDGNFRVGRLVADPQIVYGNII